MTIKVFSDTEKYKGGAIPTEKRTVEGLSNTIACASGAGLPGQYGGLASWLKKKED